LTQVVEATDELAAVATALDTAGPGELVVIGPEDIPKVLAYLEGRLVRRPAGVVAGVCGSSP
jgi:hypothetical protein